MPCDNASALWQYNDNDKIYFRSFIDLFVGFRCLAAHYKNRSIRVKLPPSTRRRWKLWWCAVLFVMCAYICVRILPLLKSYSSPRKKERKCFLLRERVLFGDTLVIYWGIDLKLVYLGHFGKSSRLT